MIRFLMLGSLVFGLIACILPSMIIIGSCKMNYNKNWAVYSIISISACAVAISCQAIYINHIVQIGDWSALMDTSGTSTLLSIILLISTLVLNGVSLTIYSIKSK